jgi:hypothetical protein
VEQLQLTDREPPGSVTTSVVIDVNTSICNTV